MDRDESSLSAAAMWAFFMAGAILLIASTIGALVSIVFISGAMDGGTGARVGGAIGLLGSLCGFWLGRHLTDDYRIYPNSHT